MVTSTITVKVILYGLLAVVPDTDADGGLTAVLADTFHPRTDSLGATMAPHVPLVLLLDGSCDSGLCAGLQREALERLRSLLSSRAEAVDPLSGLGRATAASPVLVTVPYLQEISLEALGASQAGGGPSLTEVPGAGRASPDCLADARQCPVIARFVAPVGAVTTCHRVHDETTLAHPLLFDWASLDGTKTAGEPGALGDAVALQLSLPADAGGVSLVARTLGGRELYRVGLEPSAEGEIVLVVANVNPRGEPGNPTPESKVAHFEVFSGMAQSAPDPFLVPRFMEVGTTSVSHACHSDIVRGASFIGWRDFPHNKEKCVPARLTR